MNVMERSQPATVYFVLVLVEEMGDDHAKQLIPIVSETIDEPIILV
jgi:hypothetical protein